MADGDLRQDGGYHASTSGREDLPPPLPRIGSSRMHLCELLSARSGVEYQRSDAIVSLLPSGTEILFALGLDRRWVLCCSPRTLLPALSMAWHGEVLLPTRLGGW